MRSTVLLGLLLLGGLVTLDCGDEQPSAGPFELVVHPEFVQGALPGEPVTLLVAIQEEAEGGGPITLRATATEGEVTIEPSTISGIELAELTFVAGEVAEDTDAAITVFAERGDEERELARSLTIIPGEDDRADTAREVLAFFLPWLAENRPELGLGPRTHFTGVITAPLLLVVSHYSFFTDEFEVGLAWHVTIPPNDWADIYIRPRGSLRPAEAFRLSSWSIAAAGGSFEITPTEVPPEIVR